MENKQTNLTIIQSCPSTLSLKYTFKKNRIRNESIIFPLLGAIMLLIGIADATTTCGPNMHEALSWECLVKSEAIYVFFPGILMLLSPIELLMIGRSRNITLDKQQNTLTLEWSGILDSKLGKRTLVWALADIIAIEAQHRQRRHWEFFKLCLVLKSGRRLPVTEYTLGRHQAMRDANRVLHFLELDDTVWTPGWSPDDDIDDM